VIEVSQQEELLFIYRSPIIIRIVKSRVLWWAGHVARMEESLKAYEILGGNFLEHSHLKLIGG
jgi:hypothetical protein